MAAIARRPRRAAPPPPPVVPAPPAPTTYGWRDGARFPVRPQVAGEELERIRRASGTDTLTPHAVVDESRPEDAPLHPAFEWDDELAAEKWREEEARSLIRSVRIMRPAEGDEPPQKLIAYVHVATPDEGPCYATTARVMNDEDLRRQALDDALGLLRGIQERFRHLNELREVLDAIGRLVERVG